MQVLQEQLHEMVSSLYGLTEAFAEHISHNAGILTQKQQLNIPHQL